MNIKVLKIITRTHHNISRRTRPFVYIIIWAYPVSFVCNIVKVKGNIKLPIGISYFTIQNKISRQC